MSPYTFITAFYQIFLVCMLYELKSPRIDQTVSGLRLKIDKTCVLSLNETKKVLFKQVKLGLLIPLYTTQPA